MNNKSLMNRILNSPKVFLFITIILAFVADLVSTVMIFKAGYELQYLFFPLLILVMDILFLILSIFSNYRFRYSILQMVAYLIIVLCGVGAVTILFATSVNEIIMTIVSCVLWSSVHVLGLVAVLANSLHAGKVNKKPKKFVPFFSVALLTAMVVIFTASICHNGFFGQGYIEEARTLSYVYSEEDEGYIVSNTLKGRGNTAIIPTEFNGKPVVAIDCEMLKDENLRAVRFEKGNGDIKFKNINNIKDFEMREDMTLYAEKEDIDDIKNTLFSYWDNESKRTILKLTNTFYPSNLEDEEVYITFSYSNESYDSANGVVFKTWFGQKGDTFDITFDDQVPYALHSDINDENDLHWNYKNNKLIIKPLVDNEGNQINGLKINESIKNVEVDFEKIYAVSLLDDNDAKYEIDDEYRYTYLEDENVNYKYVLEDNANNIINNIPSREGFTLSFKHNKFTFNDLSEILKDEGNQSIIEISPEWSLNAPKISKVYTNNQSNNFIYGDDVVLNCDVDSITDGISFKYKWTFKQAGYNYAGNNHVLSNVTPSQSGEYILTVEAYSDTITSLTSTSQDKIDIDIEKKTLNFEWTLPTDLIYSGESKAVSCNYDASQVINNDNITFEISNVDVYNAGKYEFDVVLKGQCADLYQIPSSDASISFEIEKREIGLSWDDKTYVYNGQKQVPSATATGLIGIDSCEVNVTVNGGKNAGTYTAIASSLSNSNYKLPTQNTKQYSISQKNISASVESGGGVYKALITPVTASLDGIETGDTVNTVITYKGTANDGTNYDSTVIPQKAGTYYAYVTITNDNYYLSETKSLFIIDKATLEAPSITSKTYTGDYLSANTLNSPLYEITKNVEKIDVGDYYVEVSLLDTNNYKWSTTNSSSISILFKITKATNAWTTTPSLSGWTYGNNASIPSYGSKFGTVKVEYRLETESIYTEYVPEKAGEYKVRFVVEETVNYSGLEKEIDFVIQKATVKVPTISSKTYTGETLTADIEDTDYYMVTSNYGGIRASSSDYFVELTLKDPSNYKWSTTEESVITLPFVIKQAQNGWTTTPSIEGWVYGDIENDPLYNSKFGTVKVEYRLVSGGSWSETVPTAAGSYYVRFLVEGTTDYTSLEKTIGLTIESKKITASVDYGGGNYDETIEPVTVTFNGVLYGDDVGLVITYSGTSYSGVTYNGTQVPLEAGTYTVTIKITNSNYSFDKVVGSFVVEKAENSWTITPSIEGWTYGDEPNDPEYQSKYGEVEVEYSLVGSNTWTKTVPVAAGEYKVRFVVEEGSNYLGISKELTFTIEEKEITANVTNGGGSYGDVDPVSASLNGVVDGDIVNIKITYTGEGYSSTKVPVAAGEYVATITIDNPNYSLIETKVTFVISQAENSWTITPSIEGWTCGDEPNDPEYQSKYGEVEVEYSLVGSNSWTKTVPVAAGEYKVRFVVEETDNYTGLSKEITFEIKEVQEEN